MSVLLRKNFASGTLVSGISDSDNQVTLSVGHTLPTDSGNFRLVIWNMVVFSNPADDPDTEIVSAAYSGTPNVYNITRAQEGTLATAHSEDEIAALHYTAGMSVDDLNFLGTMEVDETSIATGKFLQADLSEGLKKLKYASESDPIFSAAPAAGISAGNISNWNTAFGWGNHAGLYDVVGTASGLVGAHESTYNHSNYNTAYIHSQIVGGNSVHVSTTENTNWDSAYAHSQLTSGNPHSVTKTEIGLGSVENTALSTWAGSTNITTLGTIATVGNITIANGGTIGQAAGPLLTFNDTDNILGITGCWIGVGATPTYPFVLDTSLNTLPEGSPSFCIQGETNKERLMFASFGANHAPGIQGCGAGGTVASPTATKNNRLLFFLGGGGYNDTPAYTGNKALFAALATENWTTTGNGCALYFETTANGTTSPRSRRMMINHDGGVLMYALKSGATQAAAGAVADELWVDTDDGNTIKLGT